MNGQGSKCASCRVFPLTIASKSGGAARCSAWESLRSWSDSAAACVFYAEVSDEERAKRQPMVNALGKQEKEK